MTATSVATRAYARALWLLLALFALRVLAQLVQVGATLPAFFHLVLASFGLAVGGPLFRQGHRIRVEVASSSFPRYDRSPHTGCDVATETAPVVARQAVHHGAGASSRIVLPVVPR